MRDLENRKDVEKLVSHFYELVLADIEMAPVFQMSKDKWDIHIERTCNFWDNWLFQTGDYHGGLMWAHIEKNRTYPITTKLFERWLIHWFQSIDKLFVGTKADFLKTKSLELGQMMNKRLKGN